MEPIGVPFGRVFHVLRRRKGVILGIIVLGMAGVTAVVMQLPPRYTAEAQILIEPRRTQVSDLQAITTEQVDVSNLMRTQIDIFRSPALAAKVVEALDLTNMPGFLPEPGGLSALLADAKRWSMEMLGLATPAPRLEGPLDREQLAIQKVLGLITFSNEARSNVLRVSAETEDPQLSANIANEISNRFLDFKRNQKFAATQRAHDWFQERLAELSVKVRASERRISEYREQFGLNDTPLARDGEARTPSVNAQQLNEITRQLSLVTGDRVGKESRLNQVNTVLRNGGRMDTLPEVVDSPLIQALRQQEAVAIGREAQLSASASERSPEFLAAQAQRRGLQRRIQEEASNIVSGLNNEVIAIRAREASLRNTLDNLRSGVAVENAAEIQLQALTTEARANRVLYESYLNRAVQLANLTGIQEPDAEMVSPAAVPPSPSAPQRSRILVAAFLVISVLAIAIGFLLERLRTTFSSAEELEAALGIMPFGLIPKTSQRARALGNANSTSALQFAAALSKVRGGLQVLQVEKRPKVIMITSALPKEGKTVFATSFAKSAASSGWRVLLIDADMHRPGVAAQFGLSPSPGLDEVLTSTDPADYARAVRTVADRLDVLPTSVSAATPQDLLASDRMAEIIRKAREDYDVVVIDTPPVVPTVDGLILAHLTDATILAVRWEKTSRSSAQLALRLLRSSSATLVGSVLTQVDFKRAGISRAQNMAYLYRKHLKIKRSAV
ncbi:GumC family protein [Roseomonas mucosa]|uniref:GumC family protein n=1 Tax=Roseomonas TaxID=125216 RepID=UPI001D005C17|nr:MULTISPECIES: polysaccharide biosynthesis tyrosine autokinase [Roseomonas]MDT8351770.1 polysaccharide biosynthesis tyrosine autokinase [Roseomonas mucosa]